MRTQEVRSGDAQRAVPALLCRGGGAWKTLRSLCLTIMVGAVVAACSDGAASTQRSDSHTADPSEASLSQSPEKVADAMGSVEFHEYLAKTNRSWYEAWDQYCKPEEGEWGPEFRDQYQRRKHELKSNYGHRMRDSMLAEIPRDTIVIRVPVTTESTYHRLHDMQVGYDSEQEKFLLTNYPLAISKNEFGEGSPVSVRYVNPDAFELARNGGVVFFGDFFDMPEQNIDQVRGLPTKSQMQGSGGARNRSSVTVMVVNVTAPMSPAEAERPAITNLENLDLQIRVAVRPLPFEGEHPCGITNSAQMKVVGGSLWAGDENLWSWSRESS